MNFLKSKVSTMVLIPGKEYEIPVGDTTYRGTFKHHVENLAYFEPLYVIKCEKAMKHIISPGQYFHAHRIFKKIETQ